ncbi:MAG: hypothetical protein ACI4KA_08970 [Oscillospiraceae bacterium]
MNTQKNETITLTSDQWNKLTCYILMTTNFRKSEREAWEELSNETNADGTPKFPNAKKNAEYWKQMDEELEEIRRIIDGF